MQKMIDDQRLKTLLKSTIAQLEEETLTMKVESAKAAT
jgi:hypothetical protein